MRALLLLALATARAGRCPAHGTDKSATCPAPPDAACPPSPTTGLRPTTCPEAKKAPLKKVKVATFDPSAIEPARRGLKLRKLGTEDDAEWLLRRAAQDGRADAQYNLGVMFDGQGDVPPDPGEAARCYGEAAAQGHASAQFNLGNMYRKGLGVKKSLVEAARLYRKAGASKHKKAQANLENLLKSGLVNKTQLDVRDEVVHASGFVWLYLGVMGLLILVIPSRILGRYRAAVAALELIERDEPPPPARKAAPAPTAKPPARKRITWSASPQTGAARKRVTWSASPRG